MKTKGMFMSCHQTTGQNFYIKVANKCLENVFKYLGMVVTNQNCIHKEIKSRLSLGNAAMHFRIFCLPISCLKT
jgi:hypothetical protein